MVPDVVEFCEVLPRTSTGKVDRVRLAEHGQ
jgi:acyl-coenzyme A synthetase/AMP-(fatty) acid ligase